MRYLLPFHCNNGCTKAPHCVSCYACAAAQFTSAVIGAIAQRRAQYPRRTGKTLIWQTKHCLLKRKNVNRMLMTAESNNCHCSRLRLKCDGTQVENRFRLSAKGTSPFKSAGASVQSTTGSRVVRISGSNSGYTMIRESVKGTGYPLHSTVSPSLPLPCVTVCHRISTGLYTTRWTIVSQPFFPRRNLSNN